MLLEVLTGPLESGEGNLKIRTATFTTAMTFDLYIKGPVQCWQVLHKVPHGNFHYCHDL